MKSVSDYPSYPVLVHASTGSIPANGMGSINGLQSMRAPFRSAWYLDEIRFLTGIPTAQSSNNSLGIGATLFGVPAGQVLVQLSIAGQQLTKGFVPLWLLGKEMNDTIPGFFNQNNGNPPPVDRYMSWVLPRPMFIAPGDQIEATFQNLNATLSVNVKCSFAGRSCDQRAPFPDSICFPYVSFYQSAFTSFAANNLNQKSLENQLANPFNQVLHVERFVGRLASLQTISAALTFIEGVAGITTFIDAAMQWTLVKMYDSMGHILVRDPTPFGLLFNVLDRTWTCKSDLPPHSFVIATVSQQYLSTADSGSGSASQGAQAQIAMIGYREMPRLSAGYARRDTYAPNIALPPGMVPGQELP